MSYIGKTTDGFGVRNRFVYLASADDTSVSGADANGATLTFTDGAYVDVYLNGILLKPTTDYNTSTANTIAGLSALSANDEITVVVYDVFTVADMVSATSGGTFSGNVTHSGTVTVDDTTDSTSTTTGSIQTDGGVGIAKDLVVGDDILLKSDSGAIQFGADSEITLTHSADSGLLLKHANTADDKYPVLTLQTGDTDIATDDILGKIQFQAPDEATGTDAQVIAASIWAYSDGDFSASNNSASLSFQVASSGTAAEKLRIFGDGTVQVTSQDLKVGNGSTADAKVQFDANSDWTIGIDASDGGYLKVSNGEEVHSAPKMVFKAGGLIEHLASRDGNLNFFQNSHSSNPFGLSVFFDQASPDNNTSYFLKCADSSATRLQIFSDGDVSTSDAGILSSDIKLKNNITDATDKWEDVKKLKVRNFYWNEDYHPNKKDKKMIGFIAQEFETVFPGLVKEYKDTIDKEVEDENGFKSIEAVETGTTTKHIKEAKLIPILTKALQEAMTRIETLEAKVKALEEA